MDKLLVETILEVAESGQGMLLQPVYNKMPNRPRGMGWCYTASEVYWYLTGCDLLIKRASVDIPKDKLIIPGTTTYNSIRHYWLEDAKGNVIDVTACQFEELGIDPPYAIGKGCAFLTQSPSMRAKKLMVPVLKELDGMLDMSGDPRYSYVSTAPSTLAEYVKKKTKLTHTLETAFEKTVAAGNGPG